MTSLGGRGFEEQIPAVEILSALNDAQQGVMPGFTAESLVCRLGLEGDEPDNLGIMERFRGGDGDRRSLRPIARLIFGIDHLIQATNERTANPAQESIAGALGCVVTRQIRREGDICPGARQMALASTREDIIPIDVKERLSEDHEDEVLGVTVMVVTAQGLTDFFERLETLAESGQRFRFIRDFCACY